MSATELRSSNGMGRTGLVVTGLLIAGAFIVLIGLGTWQMKRLAWKEDLLATIDSRIHQPAVALSDLAGKSGQPGSIEFTPVEVSGTFAPGKAVFYLATFEGQSGWYVYQPFRLARGEWPEPSVDTLLVNRGFVPYDRRAALAEGQGVPTGAVSIEGIAREIPAEKPTSLMPDNEPQNGSFFWKDGPAMAGALGLDPDRIVPLFVDLGRPGEAGSTDGSPRPGVTQVNLPNNHLSYALTWYGLALVLVGVVAYALWQSRRRTGKA